MDRLEKTLQWHFALLTVLCGALLGSDTQTAELFGVATLAAVSSLVFVDRLQWIWLPPPLAYLLMLAASFHSMWRFFNGGHGHQIASVAVLLVLVQGILLFQKKSRRVYEQLTVFCLLQLIVSAVLNDALIYGVLLIPISLLMLSAQCHLQAWRPLDRTSSHRAFTVSEVVPDYAWKEMRIGLRRSAIGGWLLVLFMTVLSFYALPRSKAMQPRGGGSTLIGFSGSVELDQIGHLANNPATAMRISLTDARTGKSYENVEQFYVRGAVVDDYVSRPGGPGKWQSSETGRLKTYRDLPPEYFNDFRGRSGYDSVNVHVDLEGTAQSYLFSIAPYHRNIESSDLRHYVGRWLLRQADTDESKARLTSYGFGTHAFYQGQQTSWLRPYSGVASRIGYDPEVDISTLIRLRKFDAETMPTVAKVAQQVVDQLPEAKRQPYYIALALRDHLGSSGEYKYTRTMNQSRFEQLDPIEAFVSEYKEGNCQFYASTLAMMLRSQGLPARLVVGYLAHERNSLGDFWVVRQQDAHAWVEVYLRYAEIPGDVTTPGQINEGGSWLRLDPTPPDSRGSAGQVGQAVELAQSLWKNYVVEMNDRRQAQSLFNVFNGGMMGSFSAWERMQMSITRIRAGQLGEERISLQFILSWKAFLVTTLLLISALVAWQLFALAYRWLRRFQRREKLDSRPFTATYYASLVKLLARSGKRRPAQTPRDWAEEASQKFAGRGYAIPSRAVDSIVQRYYRAIYGNEPHLSAADHALVSESLEEVRSAIHK